MQNKENYNDQLFSDHNQQKYDVKTIGRCAYQYLVQKGMARILGVITKGAFLQTHTGELVFLTDESYRGPLTVNLYNRINFKDCFSTGEKVYIQSGCLDYKKYQIFFSPQTPIWTPIEVRFCREGFDQSVTRGIALVKNLIREYTDGLFYPFMNQLSVDPSKITRNFLWTFFPEVNPNDAPEDQLLRYLGLGSGLTPSGDDFLCGFLLAQYYLYQEAMLSKGFKELGARILAEAHIKTTALSSALINCALEGAADERLMDSLLFIAEGQGDIQEISNGIASYGNASGIDTLAGMLAAILNEYFIEKSP